MKTSSTKPKRPTTRAGRRGMSLAEWHRQNQWPSLADCLSRLADYQTNRLADDSSASEHSSASLKVCKSDSLTIRGLHPEDAALIAQLWDESRRRGVRFSTLAAMYFPQAESLGAAKARLCYELRCCRGLDDALKRLHHPKKYSRFTCAQLREIFLHYGSPGE